MYLQYAGKCLSLSSHEEMRSGHHFPEASLGVPHRLPQKNHADATTLSLPSIGLGVENICACVCILRAVQTIRMHALRTTEKGVR